MGALLTLGREAYRIQQVLVGCESGVALYDALTHALAKAGEMSFKASDGGRRLLNDPALSAARRDKFLMSEMVRAAGLRAARQLKTARY